MKATLESNTKTPHQRALDQKLLKSRGSFPSGRPRPSQTIGKRGWHVLDMGCVASSRFHQAPVGVRPAGALACGEGRWRAVAQRR